MTQALLRAEFLPMHERDLDGVTALGVPVYNGLGHPVVCIAVIGPHARWQTYAERADAPPAQAWLKEKAAALSAQLGFYPR